MRGKWARILALTVIIALFISAFVPFSFARTEGGPSAKPRASLPGPVVKTATDKALAKVHPKLREKLAAAGAAESIQVTVKITPGTDVSQYMTEALVRPFVDDGMQSVYGRVQASQLSKLASLPGVQVVLPFESYLDKPKPVDPDLALDIDKIKEAIQARLKVLREGGRRAVLKKGGPEPTGWYDVLDNHKSKRAWDKGFTGEGVRVAVMDDGVDFAHPDLQNTYARQPFGPYEGWPIAFDGYSLLLYAYDQYVGTNYIASGLSWYADTSTTITADNPVYQPIGAAEPHTYTLPDTSKSGVYHIGSHPDENLQYLWYGERVAVLVVDENEAGVYDTVYVDLDNDYDFTNEKPVRKGDELSYKDLNGDGYADISGGMVYFIADGVNPIPTADWFWGLGQAGNDAWDWGEPGAGDLVAFMGSLDYLEYHGTLCASNVVGQGIIDGGAPPYKPAGDGTPGTGMVVGGGKDVDLVAVGNIYTYADFLFDAYIFAVYGYDGILDSGDEVHITSNSYGFSEYHNDGWDFESRYVSRRQRLYNPTMSTLFSTGNGAPGFGTIAPPTPDTGISVGASTQMGSTGWDSISSADQITYGDVIPWSNRGPGARGDNGPDVVADGAFGSGDMPLNLVGDGWYAWITWGGTSRSAPVAAGNLALVYDAFHQANGRWPTYQEAKDIFTSGSTDLHYDTLIQGFGSVNADRATDVAGGLYGVYVSSSWSVGDYRGTEWPAFANIILPGQSDTKEFTVHNPGPVDITVSLQDRTLAKFAEINFDWVTADISEEDDYDFDRPDYLMDITDKIPADTDLMVVRVVYPWESFDPEFDYQYNNIWRVLAYDWTDVNGDGKLWEDANGNGVVNEGEIDEGEYIRFAYAYNYSNNRELLVQRPLERKHDGIYLGLQHHTKSEDIPVTHLKCKVEFYRFVDWGMLSVTPDTLTVPAGGEATFQATVNVPSNAKVGLYNGAIVVIDPGDAEHDAHETVIPVTVNVASFTPDFVFGGPPVSEGLYDNGRVRGGFDWRWRAESGDWRFYFLDVPDDTPEGTSLLIHTWWNYYPTDVDTIVMGPTADRFTTPDDPYYEPDYYGPYTLDVVGGSQLLYMGSGKWQFNTATGGPEEFVSAPATPGLNLIALHNVLFAGRDFAETIMGQAGTINAQPYPVDITTDQNEGTVQITIVSSLPLPDLVVDGYGLGAPEVYTDQVVHQDDPGDPCTASYTRTIHIEHAALLDVSTANTSADSDIDLYLYYDANGDGVFDCPGERIGASTTPFDTEQVIVNFPPDGDYLIAVHGWGLNVDPETFDLTINAVQGYDLTVTGVPAGPYMPNQPITFDLNFSRTMSEGETWQGMVLLGPSTAPGALQIPVTITRVAKPSQTVSLQEGVAGYVGTQDTTIDMWAPTTNYGALNVIRTRAADIQAGLIYFDISSIPDNVVVDNAVLKLYVAGRSNANAQEVSIYQVLRQWVEGQASWNFAMTDTPWEVPGANGATDRAATPSDTKTLDNINTWVSFDVTPIVQAWVNGEPNYGFILKADGYVSVSYSFISSEHGTFHRRPILEVTYHEP